MVMKFLVSQANAVFCTCTCTLAFYTYNVMDIEFFSDYTHVHSFIQVFLPLLVEHFSESELRQLTKTVNELHHLGPQQGQWWSLKTVM